MRRFDLLRCAALLAALTLAAPAFAAESGRDEREAGEDIQARAAWRRGRRLDGQGQLDPDALMRAKRELDARARPLGTAGTQDAGIWNWEWLGPGNVGGRLRSILIHPTNPSLMWVGTAGGGIWRTVNGGASWFATSDFLPSLSAVTLAMDPMNMQDLYAGTGELVGSNSSIPGAGIFKSTNSGLSWTQLASTANASFDYVSRIDAQPGGSGRLLAGTRTGVWRTIDGGTSWTRIFTPANGAAVRDVKYSPANPSVIAVGTETDMYLSTDGGSTFVRQTTGAANKMPLSPGRCEIAFCRNNTNYIYVSAGKDVPILNDLTDPIYRSTDGGVTWNWFMPTNADRWSNLIWVSPTDPNVVVWGGFGDLYRTTDGVTYSQISDGGYYNQGLSAHTDQHVMVAHPNYDGVSNRTVFVGNDGGIQTAANITTVTQTTGWTNLANNLGISQFFTGAAAPDGSVVMGGMQDNGTASYTPAGGQQGWTLPGGGDGMACAIDYNNTQKRYLSAQLLDLWRTTDGGTTWVSAISGLSDARNNTKCDFAAPFVMDPNDPAVLVAGGQRIWRSANGAVSWSSIRNSITGGPFCTAIDIAKSNPNVIWVGYKNGVVSHTSDGGATWFDHTLPSAREVTDIAVNPYAWNEVIVTLTGNATDNVWYTNTTGASWQLRTGSGADALPAIQVNTVRYHPLQPNWVYVGTDLGVFASEDKGLTWSVTPAMSGNEGPNNVEVDELFWQGSTYLLAASHGRGIYRCKPLPVVYVDGNYVGPEDGTEFKPYNTVAEAVAAYGPGALVSIKGNTYDEPPLVLDKRGVFRATTSPARVQ